MLALVLKASVHACRCTDGVWMSARVVREEGGAETLVVFLNCEGIGSPEREETEDMLHCLLVGAVSSLTMFKTHFAFGKCATHPSPSSISCAAAHGNMSVTENDHCNASVMVCTMCRELIETLKRLNKGARKVEDIGGKTVTTSQGADSTSEKSGSMIFRGSIMFCLKDTPADAKCCSQLS